MGLTLIRSQSSQKTFSLRATVGSSATEIRFDVSSETIERWLPLCVAVRKGEQHVFETCKGGSVEAQTCRIRAITGIDKVWFSIKDKSGDTSVSLDRADCLEGFGALEAALIGFVGTEVAAS